jgi:hypothetical protein
VGRAHKARLASLASCPCLCPAALDDKPPAPAGCARSCLASRGQAHGQDSGSAARGAVGGTASRAVIGHVQQQPAPSTPHPRQHLRPRWDAHPGRNDSAGGPHQFSAPSSTPAPMPCARAVPDATARSLAVAGRSRPARAAAAWGRRAARESTMRCDAGRSGMAFHQPSHSAHPWPTRPCARQLRSLRPPAAGDTSERRPPSSRTSPLAVILYPKHPLIPSPNPVPTRPLQARV